MQNFKDPFGAQIDDDDPWFKAHPGEYKWVGEESDGYDLYYRPGDNDEAREIDRHGDYTYFKGSGGSFTLTPEQRRANTRFHIKVAAGIIAAILVIWAGIAIVSNIRYNQNKTQTAQENIVTVLTPANSANTAAKNLLGNTTLMAMLDKKTIDVLTQNQTALNDVLAQRNKVANSDNTDEIASVGRAVSMETIHTTETLNTAYASIASDTAAGVSNAELKTALDEAANTLNNHPSSAMFSNNRDYLTGLWEAIGNAATGNGDTASLIDTINKACDNL